MLSNMDDESRRLWRARREERRARQRAANVLRAQAMHEARIAFDKEHATPPPLPQPPPGIYIGCSGWFYWHWRECFYPEGTPSSRWFDYYASQFRTVELNAPFYSWPTLATVQTWIRQTGRRKFIYSIKVNELITHTRRFARTKHLVKDFSHVADLLGARMGCLLFQLPPSFHYTRANLHRITRQLDPRLRNVIEFRHKSWWNDTVYEAFRTSGTIFCSCSGPRLPDELILTSAEDVYLRFHGTTRWYRHNYTRQELAVWADRIRAAAPKRVWAYFNNDREGFAIKNAQTLIRLLRRRWL
jgi:uncharacterized protein YecE (DUF72 family)